MQSAGYPRMRPTRWTRQKPRVTKPGRGGWSLSRYGFSYTNPVTGNGVSAGWNLRRALKMRRLQEVNAGLPPHLHVTRL